MRERLIEELDGADLFLRNRVNSEPAPLNEYDIEIMLDIANICDEAARVLERAIVPPCKVGNTVYVVSRYYTGVFEIYECTIDSITLYEKNTFLSMSSKGKYTFGEEVSLLGKTVFLTKEEAEKALKGGAGMKCTACGKECYSDKYPEVVFADEKNIICEECSIDYAEDANGNVIERKDRQ